MILGPIVRIHFKRLECPRLQWFQVRAVALLAWWGVPFTLLAFFGRYLVRHDALITTLQVILVGISTWLSLLFWRITKDTLHGTAVSRTSLGKVVLSREVLGGVVTALLFGIFSKGMLLRG